MKGLNTFREDSFIQALKNFFEDLQVPVNYIADEPANPASILGDKYKPDNPAHKLIDDVYVLGMVDDAIFEGKNQLFKEEWTTARLQKIDKDYDGLVIFGVTLKQREGDLLPTRSQLAEITRAFNRTFHYTPVTVVFKYGNHIAFANSERMKYKQEWREGERVGKVTMLKDVSIEKTHSGHMRILLDMQITLSGKDAVTSFSGLYKYWQKVFNVSTLNKSFYRELSNWYFYAMKQVSFPDDLEKDENIRNATSLIRLITRVIFIWFIKEKGLVPEAIFNKVELEKTLKEFNKSKTSCSYYQAILQNLFFGTLNQKMDDRAFTKQGAFPQNRSEYGVKNLFRYVDLFSISEEDALNLFKDVPFLNGGLFDCLDKPDDEGKILYVDGFSRNSRKQAIVPDSLFFAEEHEIDLNEIYDTKNKKYTTKGFVEILSGYKFTVEENTPIEEEVALDPELLGKVFENLLASYNPETQTTARKQTGSFYTPREIVNYMVDESLKAYLKGVLVEEFSMTEGNAQAGLDLLFAYTEKEHLFDAAETNTLISAIDSCKILDPACGSGAFPMGVLHKMVHILHKLDPNNKQWEQRQVDKVDKLIEEAQGITDTSAREQVISGLEHNKQDIEDAFGSNELDYGRKLYLIENCIYGVDIQAIAVQIAKLRFFISLVIDQKKQASKENLGIRALPNLETKFVAANTLIGLEKLGQNLLKNQKIIKLENDLKSLRHKYFSAKTRREKISWQKKDRALREEISKLLVNDGLDTTTAQLIVSFDPYDQNASAPFFDPEWMFGITDGFDVVIGNPPYFNVSTISRDFVKYLSEQYRAVHTGYNDIVYYFIYLGITLLNKTGCCVLITSNYYLGNEYAKKLRSFLGQHAHKVINFRDHMVFDTASIHTCISVSYKESKSDGIMFFESMSDKKITSSNIEKELNSFMIKRADLNDNWVIADKSNTVILEKIKRNAILLGDISIIEKGSTSGKNEVFTVSCVFAEKMSLEDSVLRKNIKNGDIDRYTVCDRGNCLIYVDNETNLESFPNIFSYLKTHEDILSGRNEVKQGLYPWYRLERPRKKAIFDADEKIVVPYRSENNRFAYDNKQYFNDGGDIRVIVIKNNKFSTKYILAILNSGLIDWFFGFIGKPKGKVREYFNGPLSLIPIKEISEVEQKPFINIVNTILYAKTKTLEKEAVLFESLIDSMVYELYFPDEIKAAGCEILKHLNNLPELNDTWNNEQKLAAIEKIYRELSDSAHPVSIAMNKMRDIPEIRIIEGRQ